MHNLIMHNLIMQSMFVGQFELEYGQAFAHYELVYCISFPICLPLLIVSGQHKCPLTL
jgi:hypothetical protein